MFRFCRVAGAAFAAVAVLAGTAVAQAATPSHVTSLQYSVNDDVASARQIANPTVSTQITFYIRGYVSSIARVDYFLDDPTGTGEPDKTATTSPFRYKRTITGNKDLGPGSHYVLALVTTTSGKKFRLLGHYTVGTATAPTKSKPSPSTPPKATPSTTPPQSTPSTCAANPGAGSGAKTLGPTSYSSDATISNVIFDGAADDDLVDVTGGKVVFDHVTFRGHGTGDSGSTLEVSGNGGVEVRNSVFEGAPTEDYIQTKGSAANLIECNIFKNAPGEDDVDMKSGGQDTVRNNTVQTVATGGDTFIMQNSTSPVIIENNSGPGMASIFFTNGAHGGRVVNNTILGGDSTLWVYDVSDILIQGNTVKVVKNGESGTNRQPSNITYVNNKVSSFQ